jgi:hypothetical protein
LHLHHSTSVIIQICKDTTTKYSKINPQKGAYRKKILKLIDLSIQPQENEIENRIELK